MKRDQFSIQDLQERYARAVQAKRAAVIAIDEQQKIIAESDENLTVIREAWSALSKVYGELPALDGLSESGVFISAYALMRNVIVEAVEINGRFCDKNRILATIARNTKLREKVRDEKYLKNISQFLKECRTKMMLVSAKGDGSNHEVYYGLPTWIQQSQFGTEFKPEHFPEITGKPIEQWEFSAKGEKINEDERGGHE
jgi:hypothetical protein